MKKIFIVIIFILLLLLLSGLYLGTREGLFGATAGVTRRNFIKPFGSSAVTLTSGYTGAGAASSTGNTVAGLHHYAFAGTYTPKSHNSVAQILVQKSLEPGCGTYYPVTILSDQDDDTDEMKLYTAGSSTVNGIPVTIPGTYSSASGTAISFTFDFVGSAECLKISARESTTSTAGTLYLETLMTSE